MSCYDIYDFSQIPCEYFPSCFDHASHFLFRPARTAARRLHHGPARRPADGSCHSRRPGQRRGRLDPAAPDRTLHEPGLSRPVFLCRPAHHHWPSRVGIGGHPGDRLPHHRPHGALRLRKDPRPRHPRSHGSHPDRQEPHPAEGGGAQARVVSGVHRHRRPVRRRRTHHHDGRRDRVAAGADHPPGRRRTQDTPGRRRGGRHDGHLWNAPGRGVAGG